MAKKAVLLLNLGSPRSTDEADVREYLSEFLGDPRVLDIPKWRRDLLLNAIILRTRPKNSAEAYARVWTDEGSPLIVTSLAQHALVSEKVDPPVYLAMRYGEPSTPDVVGRMVADGVEEMLIMPLYPHYAMSSYETAVVCVTDVLAEVKPDMRWSLLPPFYNDPGYIDVLYETARPHIEEPHDKLLFSYHGIPERHLRKNDPSGTHCLSVKDCCKRNHPAHATCYRHQCFETTRLFIERAGLDESKCAVSFQSRLGRTPWLQPYTDHEIERFAKEGVKRLHVMCPSFVADCLETLEEIAMEGADEFKKAGGEELKLVPCPNQHTSFIDWLAKKITAWAGEETVKTETACYR